MIEISVIVPVFNEASNIKQFLTRATKILKKIGKNFEY